MSHNNLFEALSQGNNQIVIMTTIADLREFALAIVEETEARRKKSADASETNEPGQEQKEMPTKDLLSAQEVCQILGVSNTTLWRWQKSGYLLPMLVGSGKVQRRRYKTKDVERIAASM